jgi:hypothetical protein
MKDEPNPLLVVDIPASPELNPVQNVLALCGMNPVAGRQIFIDLEGLDTFDAFANLLDDTVVRYGTR